MVSPLGVSAVGANFFEGDRAYESSDGRREGAAALRTMERIAGLVEQVRKIKLRYSAPSLHHWLMLLFLVAGLLLLPSLCWPVRVLGLCIGIGRSLGRLAFG